MKDRYEHCHRVGIVTNTATEWLTGPTPLFIWTDGLSTGSAKNRLVRHRFRAKTITPAINLINRKLEVYSSNGVRTVPELGKARSHPAWRPEPACH